VQAAEPGNQLASRPQIEMKRITQDQAIADAGHFLGQHRFDGASRSHGHEAGGFDFAIAQTKDSSACASGGIAVCDDKEGRGHLIQ
jgi:hypothetical protein